LPDGADLEAARGTDGGHLVERIAVDAREGGDEDRQGAREVRHQGRLLRRPGARRCGREEPRHDAGQGRAQGAVPDDAVGSPDRLRPSDGGGTDELPVCAPGACRKIGGPGRCQVRERFEKMSNVTQDQVIEYLSNLSVMDIAKLTKTLEEK